MLRWTYVLNVVSRAARCPDTLTLLRRCGRTFKRWRFRPPPRFCRRPPTDPVDSQHARPARRALTPLTPLFSRLLDARVTCYLPPPPTARLHYSAPLHRTDTTAVFYPPTTALSASTWTWRWFVVGSSVNAFWTAMPAAINNGQTL